MAERKGVSKLIGIEITMALMGQTKTPTGRLQCSKRGRTSATNG